MGRSTDRHLRLRAVFDEALLCDPAVRDAYLERACADDPGLRPEVVRLLAAHDEARSFLEHPAPWLPEIAGGERFPEHERFQLRRRVGAGGMGVVYEAHDDVRHEVVALKTLRRSSAADLYWLKREFRSLADVTHPNLVCLYELFVGDDGGFFTMEMVEGVSFVEHVRGITGEALAYDRFVPAARQLVEGVLALHRQGKLHRDIKPSNVLVTPDDRVVILDFGLSAERQPAAVGDPDIVAGGTPAYMSPEESAGARPSEASDWYAVGVTLYEALTGLLPFPGVAHDVLRRKRTDDPPAPDAIDAGVPAAFSELCMGLLCRDPQQRLDGPTALRALDRRNARRPGDVPPPAPREPSFVGRTSELQALRDALAMVGANGAATVCLHGPSGIGKSALVARFIGEVANRDVVVLSGRCYENESVPYKALDGAIDALSRFLLAVPRDVCADLLPPDVAALTRVFPVLLQVEAIADAGRARPPAGADLLDLRFRAFTALRELLCRLAGRRPLVVGIDDLQWADADSTALLESLLNAPAPPAMLTVLSFRSEEAAKPFLRDLLERARRAPWSSIALGPMTDDEAGALVRDLVADAATLSDAETARIAREAEGSPFVLEQLAWHVGAIRPNGQAPTLRRMFETRLEALPSDALRFLETLALCGRPMAPDLICEACGVSRDRQSLVVSLRAGRFIRSSGSSARVETYHDRIREALSARVEPDAAQRMHRLVAEALVARRSDDCEALFEHYRGAGDRGNATVQAILAAEKAASSLAFDRAASFYRYALALAPDSPARQTWREGFATALANAGRPPEAADAYLDAAREADHVRAVELRRRAAEQFLIGGHIDRGLDLIRDVLATVGIRPARTVQAALWSMLWRRGRLRLRGLQFTARAAEAIDPETLLRVDTCWSAASGLATVDIISAIDFSVRHLLLALEAGDPSRVARAMAFESVARGAYPSGRRLSARLVKESRALAESTGHPPALALSILADAIVATTLGEWERARVQSERAVEILRDQCVGLNWETNMAQNVAIWALMYLGELGEVCRRVPALVANARSRGNLYLATELCTRSNYVWLAADDPDGGEREVIASIARWSQKHFHRQHYSALLARVQTALYRGDAQGAWRLLDEHEAPLRRSLLTQVQVLRIESLYLRGRAALAMAATTGNTGRFLPTARASARRIARERMPWSNPIARLLEAGVACLEGRDALTRTHLLDAAGQFDRADMRLYAAVARRRLGLLDGSDLRTQAEAWMASQSIRNPACLTRMLAPGFPDTARP